jgi:hypothetical protein
MADEAVDPAEAVAGAVLAAGFVLKGNNFLTVSVVSLKSEVCAKQARLAVLTSSAIARQRFPTL